MILKPYAFKLGFVSLFLFGLGLSMWSDVASVDDCNTSFITIGCEDELVILSQGEVLTTKPGYLQKYLFKDLGTETRRITSSSLFAGAKKRPAHRYSRRQAWNADETLIDLDVGIVDAVTFNVIYEWLDLTTARNWSNTDPDIMFGIRASPKPNVFGALTLSTGEFETFTRFDNYERCTIGEGEGNLSNDDSLVVFVCWLADQSKELVSYDIVDRRVLGVIAADAGINWASASQSGRYIVVENKPFDDDPDTLESLYRYEPDLTDKTLLTNDRNHGDLGVDDQGQDVFVMIDWYRISYVVLSTRERVRLGVASKKHYPGHGHVSCRNIHRPGWCYLSGSDSSAIGAVRLGQDSSWLGKIKSLGISGAVQGVSAYEPWGFHFSQSSSYDAQPKVSASPSGTQIIYSSDWMANGSPSDFVISLDLVR